MSNKIEKSSISSIDSSVIFEGKLSITAEVHLHGKITGTIEAQPGSLLIIKEGASVKGKFVGYDLIIEGYFEGEIESKSKVVITPLGRVIGKLVTETLVVQPGAFFQATVKM